MGKHTQIIQEVEGVYQWLDKQLSTLNQSCNACGKCCDFESFGHRLYVTTPELQYFRHHSGSEIQLMTEDVCPYRIDGKCTVYSYRFSGCRIFTCKGGAEKENEICETAIKKFKALCEKYDIPYHYVYLQVGLEMLNKDPEFSIHNS